MTLKDAIERRYADALTEPVQVRQDALLLALHNGVAMELRFGAAHEYAIAWRWGDAELRIDTAPLHPQLATFPNHLHDAEGKACADPLTNPLREPWHNVRTVIDAVWVSPLLD